MKKTSAFLVASLLLATSLAHAQVGVGTTTPNSSSILDVSSSTKGLLAPRLTLAQRNAIGSPATGLLIYQTDSTPGFYVYTGAAWTAVSTAPTTDAAALTTGTLAAARLPGTVTTQGNTFNGTSQLVQTTAAGALPALSGTNLTNLNATGLATGTVPVARLASSGTASASTFLRGDNTWAAPAAATPTTQVPNAFYGHATGTATNFTSPVQSTVATGANASVLFLVPATGNYTITYTSYASTAFTLDLLAVAPTNTATFTVGSTLASVGVAASTSSGTAVTGTLASSLALTAGTIITMRTSASAFGVYFTKLTVQ